MSAKHRLIVFLQFLLETAFPKKKYSAAVERRGVAAVIRQRKVIQTRGHLALLSYNNTSVKHFLYAIKYERHKESIMVAADMLRSYICDEIQEMETIQRMQYVLCTIPITEERKMNDGYNHLYTVLDAFHTHFPDITPPVQDKRGLLVWTRPVSRQSRLQNRLDRHQNVRGALSTTNPLFSNTIYFVIDDITTTGATLTEARRVLLANGARTVITLALAH